MHSERAFAKLNLYLAVTGKRADGYHDLVSIMQTVSLCDFLTMEYFPGIHTSIALEVSGNAHLPGDCRNLAYRAAEAFLKRTGRRGEVSIRLDKRIPMAAGLGGGSADAAAVLRGLNRLSGCPLNAVELSELAATLGADVPFCIKGGTAVATSVGDRLTPVAPMPQCTLVVACGAEGVSTPEAYRLLDMQTTAFTSDDDRPALICDAFCKGDLATALSRFYNAFEPVVEPMRSEVTAIKKALLQEGAAFAMMSGSGPSVFAVFWQQIAAATAAESLTKKGISAFVCHPVGSV